MQQGAFEPTALIRTRPSNTIRACGMTMAASEAGPKSAPDDAPTTAPKIPLAHRAATHAAQIGLKDSSRETSVIAGGHRQTEAPCLPQAKRLRTTYLFATKRWFRMNGASLAGVITSVAGPTILRGNA